MLPVEGLAAVSPLKGLLYYPEQGQGGVQGKNSEPYDNFFIKYQGYWFVGQYVLQLRKIKLGSAGCCFKPGRTCFFLQ